MKKYECSTDYHITGVGSISNQLHCNFQTAIGKGRLLHLFHFWNGGTIFLTDLLLFATWLCWRYTPQRGEIWRNIRWSTVGVIAGLLFLDILNTLMTVAIILVPLYPIWANDQTLCSKETFITAIVASGVNLFFLLGGTVCLVGVLMRCYQMRQQTSQEKAPVYV